jgi:hypothetical protein
MQRILLARYERAGGALLYRSVHLQQPKKKGLFQLLF